MGDGTTTPRTTPTPVYRSGVLAGLKVKSISMGDNHTCAIASDNNAYCWGNNGSTGDLGNGETWTTHDEPVAVDRSGALAGLTVKSISVGPYHTCVIASDNNAYCWGSNYDRQLGDNTTVNFRTTPVAVDRANALNGLTIKKIASGGEYTCVIASDDNAYCWGYNYMGQMGLGTTGSYYITPIAVDRSGVLSGVSLENIFPYYRHTCAIDINNKLYCWGYNQFGQIGDGLDFTSSLLPTSVLDPF